MMPESTPESWVSSKIKDSYILVFAVDLHDASPKPQYDSLYARSLEWMRLLECIYDGLIKEP